MIPTIAMYIMFILTPNSHGDKIVSTASFQSEKACNIAVEVLKKEYKLNAPYSNIIAFCVKSN